MYEANHDSRTRDGSSPYEAEIISERLRLFRFMQGWLELPMVALAFVWLALIVWEFVWGASRWVSALGIAIWVVFVMHFALELTLAPRKRTYLRKHWLTALSLLVPAIRVLRIVRALRLLRLARATRGLRLLRVVSSLNRGMAALSEGLNRRGFPYVVVLTLVVTIAGAAGMYAFESDEPSGFATYGDALWWTAMIMTTMGSSYWPATLEGRMLCVFLSLYAFGVFGYVTATLASFLVGKDVDANDTGRTIAEPIAALAAEVAALRAEVSRHLDGGRPDAS